MYSILKNTTFQKLWKSEKIEFSFLCSSSSISIISKKSIYEVLKTYTPKLAMSYAMIRVWLRNIKPRQQDLEDKHRSGSQITKLYQTNIAEILNRIKEGLYITYY